MQAPCLRRLESGYEYSFQVSLTYTFGSNLQQHRESAVWTIGRKFEV